MKPRKGDPVGSAIAPVTEQDGEVRTVDDSVAVEVRSAAAPVTQEDGEVSAVNDAVAVVVTRAVGIFRTEDGQEAGARVACSVSTHANDVGTRSERHIDVGGEAFALCAGVVGAIVVTGDGRGRVAGACDDESRVEGCLVAGAEGVVTISGGGELEVVGVPDDVVAEVTRITEPGHVELAIASCLCTQVVEGEVTKSGEHFGGRAIVGVTFAGIGGCTIRDGHGCITSITDSVATDDDDVGDSTGEIDAQGRGEAFAAVSVIKTRDDG